MSAQLDFTALVFLVLAVVVFLKLRSVLGRRTDDDDARTERFRNQRAAQQSQQGPQSDGKIVTLPRRGADGPVVEAPSRDVDAERDLRMTSFAGGNAALSGGLISIGRRDEQFDPVEFMKGSKAAYEMIVMAFAEGNRKILNDLLSADVFGGFMQAIKTREDAKETVEQTFVSTKSAEMLEADLKGATAHVTVKFVSEMINATRSAAGEVISGDPKRIKEVTDIWTFARDVSARDPNWKLVSTQAAT
jgi:predicted lipid-binding transport protein (Tim44 family)